MRSLLTTAASLAAVLVSTGASANSGGVAGYTGKPNLNAPQGESCNQCHTGGTAPGVVINGPASLAAGASAEYTLVVSTAQVRAAGAVAATDGVMLTPGTGMRDSFGEMVQNAPLTVSGGQATFRFTVKAPLTGTTLRLWGVGLAANNAQAANGDRAAHVTRDITVTGGAAVPDAGVDAGAADAAPGSDPPPEDADAAAPAEAGAPGTDADDPEGELAAEDESDDPSSSSSSSAGPGRTRLSGPDTAQSCASSPIGAGRGVFFGGVLFAAGIAVARRRRSRA